MVQSMCSEQCVVHIKWKAAQQCSTAAAAQWGML